MPMDAAPPDSPVPVYALYGETDEDPVLALMHCESIAARSRLHDWVIREHRHHGLFQVLFLRVGSAEVGLDDRVWTLNGPAVVVMPSPAVHGFRFSRDVDGWVVTMPDPMMHELVETVPGLAARLDAPRVLPLESAQERAVLEALFAGVADEFAKVGADRYCALRGYLSVILVHVGRAVAADPLGGERPDSRKERHLRAFRAAVEESFRYGCSIRTYAAELGLTTVHLNRLCRELLGCSALDVVHDRLLLEAKRQLIYTSMAVNEIAYALGFSNPAYFSRFFSRRCGQTPTAFRASAQRAIAA